MTRAAFLLSCFCGTCSALGFACTTRPSASKPIAAAAPTIASNQPEPLQLDAGAPTLVATVIPIASSSEPRPAPMDARAPVAGAPVRPTPIICPESPPVLESGTPCGDLHCLAFDTLQAAFAHILETRPRVLGIGETHAQKGTEKIPSATRRFAEWLLPSLCGRTKAMILEVWLPRNDCGDKRVEQVARAQKPATLPQAESNQNEYVTLGHVAKRLGIEPSALVPTCDEYQSILDAGPDSIERMLTLIGKKTADRLIEELHRHPSDETGPVVIAYGGALHNDAEPTPDHLNFSYGPRLLAETQGHYVELDLIVREYVKDTELWQKQPYYKALRKNPVAKKTLVYQWGPHSFGLVFAVTKAVQSQPSRP